MKLSFEPLTSGCKLYYSHAEQYHTDGLISGILVGRYRAVGGVAAGAALGNSPSTGTIHRSSTIHPSHTGGGVGVDFYYDGGVPEGDKASAAAEDLFPAFATMAAKSPPPLPPPSESTVTQLVFQFASAAVGILMLVGVLLCVFCFVSSGGKAPLDHIDRSSSPLGIYCLMLA